MPSIKPTGTHGYSGHGDYLKSAPQPVENETSIQHQKTHSLGLQSIGSPDIDPAKKMVNKVTSGNSVTLHLSDYVRVAFDNINEFIKQILNIFLGHYSKESNSNELKAVSLDPKLNDRLRILPVNSDEFALSYAGLNSKIAKQEKYIQHQNEQFGKDDPNPEIMSELLSVKAEADVRIDDMAMFCTQYMKGDIREKAIKSFKRGVEVKGLRLIGSLVLPVVKKAEKTVVVDESQQWHLADNVHGVYNDFKKFIYQVADIFVRHHDKEPTTPQQHPKLRVRIRTLCVGGDIFNVSYAEVKKLIADREKFIAYQKENLGKEDPEPEIMLELQSIKAEADKKIDEMANLCTRGMKGAVRAKAIRDFKHRIDNQENMMPIISSIIKNEKALTSHQKRFGKIAVNDGAIPLANYSEEVLGNQRVTNVEDYDLEALGEAGTHSPLATPPQSPVVPKKKS